MDGDGDHAAFGREVSWAVMDAFFADRRVCVQHHLDSFDEFVAGKIPGTLRALNPFVQVHKGVADGVNVVVRVYVGEAADGVHWSRGLLVDAEAGAQRPLLPNECRLRDLTYRGILSADVRMEYSVEDAATKRVLRTETRSFPKVRIGEIPVMLRSGLCLLHDASDEKARELGECPYDRGGYFVVDGKEKVIVAQERVAANRVFVNRVRNVTDPHGWEMLMRSTSEDNPLFPKTLRLFVRRDDRGRGTPDAMPNAITAVMPAFGGAEFSVVVLFRALGLESDRAVVECVAPAADGRFADFLRWTLVAATGRPETLDQRSAIRFLASRSTRKRDDLTYARYVLANDLFPQQTGSHAKALFLGHVVGKLVAAALGATQPPDRDDHTHKRVDVSGYAIGNLFRDYYNHFREAALRELNREFRGTTSVDAAFEAVHAGNVSRVFDSRLVTDGLHSSLKGHWGKPSLEGVAEHDTPDGIIQDLSRTGYNSALSHLRRIGTDVNVLSEERGPRRQHGTQYGYVCPIETPDGAHVGLIKNLAATCSVSFDVPTAAIREHLAAEGLVTLDAVDSIPAGHAKVLLNGAWVGMHADPGALCVRLRGMKLGGRLDPRTSVAWDIAAAEVRLHTEAGRCCRPLFVVRDGVPAIDAWWRDRAASTVTWDDLVRGDPAPVEYLDAEESAHALIAMRRSDLTARHTHLEIHPSAMMGLVALGIPLAPMNPGPRNLFACTQTKQAVGVYVTGRSNRIDTVGYVLNYPQRPLVGTRYLRYTDCDVLPNGENLTVAVLCHTGYNQEDSVIVNRGSVQRGRLGVTYSKCVVVRESVSDDGSERVVFQNPLAAVAKGALAASGLKRSSEAYASALDEHGMPKPGLAIREGTPIVGRIRVSRDPQTGASVVADASEVGDKFAAGTVDRVFVCDDPASSAAQRTRMVKIRLIKNRVPELGDKCCSRHGQKGVIGAMLDEVDMPRTADGVVPDLIVNPHAFPSRMTVGHLLEAVLAKAGAMRGVFVDATAFDDVDRGDLLDTLQADFGRARSGEEVLYCGRTGRQLPADVFMCPTFYQRLKQMVADKLNFRLGFGASHPTAAGGRVVRSREPIDAVTRQPNQGRGALGALRLGEMERDVFVAHGAASMLRECYMEKSDLYRFHVDKSDGFAGVGNIADGTARPRDASRGGVQLVETPHAFKLLAQELTALGVGMRLGFEDADTEAATDVDAGVDADVETDALAVGDPDA